MKANAIKSERARPPHPGEDEQIAERRVRAFGLRKSGASYRQIAKHLNVSLNTAWADINAELLDLRQQTKTDAEEVRELELQRCDEMLLGLWPAVRRGDPRAVMAAVRVSERRAKLLGIDAPTQIGLSGGSGGPVQVAAVRLDQYSPEQLADLRALIAHGQQMGIDKNINERPTLVQAGDSLA